MAAATRIVLVKPGDVLIFGNVGDMDQRDFESVSTMLDPLKQALGLERILVFEADIDLATVPGDGKGA